MARRRRLVWGLVAAVWTVFLLAWGMTWMFSAAAGNGACQEYRGSSALGVRRWTAIPLASYCDYSELPPPPDDPRIEDVHPFPKAGTGTVLLQAPLVVLPVAAGAAAALRRRSGSPAS